MPTEIPKTVTYKELMLVYGFDKSQAVKKIFAIRGVLGKRKSQLILVAEFCEAENVKKEIFVSELAAAIAQLHR